jgi:hypothetical protein
MSQGRFFGSREVSVTCHLLQVTESIMMGHDSTMGWKIGISSKRPLNVLIHISKPHGCV